MNDFIKQFNTETTNKETSQIDKVTFANLIGIQTIKMGETIIEDIFSMINKKQYNSLEGYVLCLSRIISHKIAWDCIMIAFERSKTSIPPHYYKLFQQTNSTPSTTTVG